MFNDGPMDASGNWIDRPLAILEDIEDKLELHFDKVKQKIEDDLEKVHDHFEQLQDKFDDDLKSGLKPLKLGGHAQKSDGNKAKKPASPPKTPSAPGQSMKAPDNSKVPKEPEETKKPSSGSKESSGDKEPSGSKEPSGNKEAAATCNPSNSHVRYEWSSYAKADRTAFVTAIKCLQGKPSGGSQFTGSQNRYEDLISVHRGMTANIHQTAAFLVWHRYFVWVFEQLLRDECGFDKAMPWWDETKHAGNFAASDVFIDEWFGHLPAKTSDGQGTCIVSGEFSGTTLHVGPGQNNENHCLSRAVDESQTAQCNKDFTNSCLSMKSYEEFRDCFELGPHGYGHNGIGAVMAEVSASVGDPIFFMHHLFVDHTFRIWQNANPSRRTTISGCADAKSPCTPITLDTMLSSSGIMPDMAVRDALNTLSGPLCYHYNY
ncbi:Di-copper centre-containing protein [Astrocystis sublimbata]|nr:Di-copper centre-containing protein [Astrocystis sublimbata]